MAGSTEAKVEIIGGGLAGSEAALQLSSRGIAVRLFEMRPEKMTPAHHTGRLAELVCSNSMKSEHLPAAPGLLKAELALLGSRILELARRTRVPAGSALAVDREEFSGLVTQAVEEDELIELVREERAELSRSVPTILATGPLTSERMERALKEIIGSDYLHFYDAAAPLVEASSVDMSRVFVASRYGKGDADYINCPLNEEKYERFYDALVSAERVVGKDFENRELFSACQPVEEIAVRGRDALRYGPMKPVGLLDPRTGNRPYAVVQLRRDNAAGTLYNLVGFQTNLRWAEQDRVFRLIPGLEEAEFSRYGVMHRNTFIDSPRSLRPDLALRESDNIRLAGQLTGSEGYMEAAATGLVAALSTYAWVRGWPAVVLPATSAIGALIDYVTGGSSGPFQPQHANLGLLPELEEPVKKKKARHEALAKRALADLSGYIAARDELHIEAADGGTRTIPGST
ncbi:MAG: methylenetetrahydrofolate--tRNA-(uracil(54)-C(5))-methyltransferase (FADH(2)-oxidizing) TrmFO [Actinobacteria bacterium]|nr:MAG: methylenetetrahydrofolate--tRNA-(uracil(54)-C(5))-methyltransferase (FADH(2)-oxidizing) TrmFO [Actinomycetota bacterium]